MAFLTAQAQTALTQGGDVTACYGYICRYLGQDQVKNRDTGVHDAAGETHDGQTVLKIAQKEHGAGEHRGSVADNIRADRLDAAGGVVVRVHTHAAGAEDHIRAPLPHGKHRIPDVLHTVTGIDHLRRLDARSAYDPFRHPSTTWGEKVLRQDTSGPAVRAMLEEAGFSVAHTAILPDEMEQIRAELRDCADRRRIDPIVTTGGTGLSPWDVTPEATRAVLEREIPAIPVAMWVEGLKVTPRLCCPGLWPGSGAAACC